MRGLAFMFLIACLAACNKPGNSANSRREATDSIQTAAGNLPPASKSAIKKLSILVLPPYDKIAHESISPNIRKFLEEGIAKDSSVKLIDFPFRDLMNVPYQNAFDKRYCQALVGRIDADIFIMSKIDLKERTGEVVSDKWSFAIRIYDVKNDRQKDSQIVGKNLTHSEISELIQGRRKELTAEIKSYRQQMP
jgi:hypothetical protein